MKRQRESDSSYESEVHNVSPNKKFKPNSNESVDKSIDTTEESSLDQSDHKVYGDNIKRLDHCVTPIDKDIIIDNLLTFLSKTDYDTNTCYLCGWIDCIETNWVKCKKCHEYICEICSGWTIHNIEKCNQKKYGCTGRRISCESYCEGIEGVPIKKPKVLCFCCSLKEKK